MRSRRSFYVMFWRKSERGSSGQDLPGLAKSYTTGYYMQKLGFVCGASQGGPFGGEPPQVAGTGRTSFPVRCVFPSVPRLAQVVRHSTFGLPLAFVICTPARAGDKCVDERLVRIPGAPRHGFGIDGEKVRKPDFWGAQDGFELSGEKV
jgi:hypothetical protein